MREIRLALESERVAIGVTVAYMLGVVSMALFSTIDVSSPVRVVMGLVIGIIGVRLPLIIAGVAGEAHR